MRSRLTRYATLTILISMLFVLALTANTLPIRTQSPHHHPSPLQSLQDQINSQHLSHLFPTQVDSDPIDVPAQLTTLSVKATKLGTPYRIFDVDRMGPALYFVTGVFAFILFLSISRLVSIIQFIPIWSAIKLLYTTITIHMFTRTLGLLLLILLTTFNIRKFSYEIQAILFTFPEYCFIALYLIVIVQWITSLLNAYGGHSIINGSKCRKWTRIFFFSSCFLIIAASATLYVILWIEPNSVSDAIEITCMSLNFFLVVFTIAIAFIMYCCVLRRSMTNVSYVSLQVVKKISYIVVVMSLSRLFRGVIFYLSLILPWQQAMEPNVLSMSIISILVLCELLPLLIVLDWRFVFILLGHEEISEAKIGDQGSSSVSLFLPFDFNPRQRLGSLFSSLGSATTTTGQNNNNNSSSNNNNNNDNNAFPSSQSDLQANLSRNNSDTESQTSGSSNEHYGAISRSSRNTPSQSARAGPTSVSFNEQLLEHGERSDLADPLLLPQFNTPSPVGPCFDPNTLLLPRALFLPNNQKLHDPPPRSEQDLDPKAWNGIYYGYYYDKLTTMSQVIYSNPLWITCSGYTQAHKRIAIKRFVLPGLDETALRELGIEAFSRGQLFLQCKNILPVLGFNITGSSLCLISEYKSRRSLFDFLRSTDKNIAPLGVLKIATGIANGLECLHNNDVVHGHLNSRNILLDEQLNVYVGDVGDRFVRTYAQAMYGEHIYTQWSAPEVLNGLTSTKSSDVYSFGVICWELCYRTIPFQQYSLKELRKQVGHPSFKERLSLPTSDDIAQAQMFAKNQGKSIKHVIPYPFIHLISRCFREPDLRPSFSDIVQSLQRTFDILNDPNAQ